MRPLIPDRWRSRRGGRTIDPQGNILTMPATSVILTDDFGTIIDDSAPDPACCCGCPDCYIPRTAGECCSCLPTRLLCAFIGVSFSCDCFVNSCPLDPPGGWAKASGSLGTFCSTQFDPLKGYIPFGGVIQNFSTGSGPCDPLALSFEADEGRLNFGASYGVNCVQVDIRADIGGSDVFIGQALNLPCEGPWLVNNSLTAGCEVYQPFCDGLKTTSGGSAIVYPCGC